MAAAGVAVVKQTFQQRKKSEFRSSEFRSWDVENVDHCFRWRKFTLDIA